MTAPDQRHVVIVGGGGGIGQAMAARFAQAGCAMHLLDRDPLRLQEQARELAGTARVPVAAAECHLDQPESLARALAAPPRIDVLVNAAGSIPRRSLAETGPADWRGTWSDKVLGTIEASRLACERMRATGHGVIVNIIGTAGVRPNPRTIMTGTANAALIAFTQALGAQSVDWGVRVVGINPGLTSTPRTRDMAEGRGTEAYQALLRDLPMQRMARPEEIAECAWFLASPGAAYISGTVIDVDGGARCRV